MIKSYQGRPVEFSDAEAPGAWPNGTRVRKICSSSGDKHTDGALAYVRGSLGAGGMVGYFVEWDDLPLVPVFIAGLRLAKVDP